MQESEKMKQSVKDLNQVPLILQASKHYTKISIEKYGKKINEAYILSQTFSRKFKPSKIKKIKAPNIVLIWLQF